MIGTNQYTLTWEHFNQIHTDKRMAFENLCHSLFVRNLCQEGTITHSDHNHPGIEVAPVLARDGNTRISFQAKYFDRVINYSKIKESANMTVKYYNGKLDVVYLYCNQSITETCDSFVKIKEVLSKASIDIVLITNQTILNQAMDYQTILSCYFGLDSLDNEWFKNNVSLSTENLGRRYNSLFNIDTDIQNSISIFLREKTGIDIINAKKIEIVKRLNEFKWLCDREYWNNYIVKLIQYIELLDDVDATTLSNSIRWKYWFENDNSEMFESLKSKLITILGKIEECSYTDSNYEKLRNEQILIERILSVSSLLECSAAEIDMINCKIVVVEGEMGTGKSQLLATTAKRMIEDNRPTLLLLGQMFITDESVEYQIMQSLEGLSSGQTFESLIAVMDEKGGLIGKDAVIIIDALNESKNREIWKNGINKIITTLKRYNNIKLIISLREEYEKLTLSQSVIQNIGSGSIAIIRHTGFLDESPSKIYEFLSHYGIPFSPEYYLHAEMANPLFLTWFCSTYNGEEHGLYSLIDNVLLQADQEGSKAVGMSEMSEVLRPLIYDMLDISDSGMLNKQSMLELSTWSTYGIVNKISYLNAIERTGVLATYVRDLEEYYYIGYNLLEEYLKATRIVEREKSKERILEYCEKNLLDIDDNGNIKKNANVSTFVMVTSLYAIKYNEELIGLVDKINNNDDKKLLIDRYYSSFVWRSSYITYDRFIEIIQHYPVGFDILWNVFIENAVKENSELNAIGLTKFLSKYTLNQRDLLWTTEINKYDDNNRVINLAYYIEEGNPIEGLSNNMSYLLLVTYTWMLSSSNRYLRDRVSKAMVEILKKHFSVCVDLLDVFKNVDDPYIIQRLYGIIFGAVMKRENKSKREFKQLALWIYEELFNKEKVYPDILLRDYAKLIVERFAIEYPEDLESIDLERIMPPYNSEPIPIVEVVDYGSKEYLGSGLEPLLYSMKFDMNVKGAGLYGDFGRYIFQSALGYFSDVDKANIYYYAMSYILNDLGYDVDYFSDYDNKLKNYNRHSMKRIERIGKKYQWITMYNVLARVADYCSIKNWDGYNSSADAYEGPWELGIRDFDPTLNIKPSLDVCMPQIVVPQYGKECFIDINANKDDIKKWIEEDDSMFLDYPGRFINKDESGKEWVSLYIYQENRFNPNAVERDILGDSTGEQLIWTMATMYIIQNSKQIYDEPQLTDSQFDRLDYGDMMNCSSLFLREYAWSSGYKSVISKIENEYLGTDEKFFSAAINYLWEAEYDASKAEPVSFFIPNGHIIQVMNLYEKENDGIYYMDEEVVAMDLKRLGMGHSELVIRRDVIDQYIKKTGAQVFWKVLGEKQYFKGEMNQEWKRREGYFVYGNKKINGCMKCVE